jgi:hypothetical protein
MDDDAPEPDDLDKEQIEQLHAVTLQVSSNCFELKKLCTTVLIAAGTLIVTLTRRELDDALLVAGLVVVLVFWAADAQSYFIQAKLRSRMKELQETASGGSRRSRATTPQASGIRSSRSSRGYAASSTHSSTPRCSITSSSPQYCPRHGSCMGGHHLMSLAFLSYTMRDDVLDAGLLEAIADGLSWAPRTGLRRPASQ